MIRARFQAQCSSSLIAKVRRLYPAEAVGKKTGQVFFQTLCHSKDMAKKG